MSLFSNEHGPFAMTRAQQDLEDRITHRAAELKIIGVKADLVCVQRKDGLITTFLRHPDGTIEDLGSP